MNSITKNLYNLNIKTNISPDKFLYNMSDSALRKLLRKLYPEKSEIIRRLSSDKNEYEMWEKGERNKFLRHKAITVIKPFSKHENIGIIHIDNFINSPCITEKESLTLALNKRIIVILDGRYGGAQLNGCRWLKYTDEVYYIVVHDLKRDIFIRCNLTSVVSTDRINDSIVELCHETMRIIDENNLIGKHVVILSRDNYVYNLKYEFTSKGVGCSVVDPEDYDLSVHLMWKIEKVDPDVRNIRSQLLNGNIDKGLELLKEKCHYINRNHLIMSLYQQRNNYAREKLFLEYDVMFPELYNIKRILETDNRLDITALCNIPINEYNKDACKLGFYFNCNSWFQLFSHDKVVKYLNSRLYLCYNRIYLVFDKSDYHTSKNMRRNFIKNYSGTIQDFCITYDANEKKFNAWLKGLREDLKFETILSTF